MTKDQFMHYCWSRSFKYGEVHRIGIQKGVKDIPTREEYNDYSRESDDFYKFHLDKDYNA